MSSPSEKLRLLQSQLPDLRPLGLAKCRSRREDLQSKFNARFSAAVSALLASNDWTQGDICRALDNCDHKTLRNWLRGVENVPTWALEALPKPGQAEFSYSLLNSEPPSSRTGTGG